jgi:hypothetical protein
MQHLPFWPAWEAAFFRYKIANWDPVGPSFLPRSDMGEFYSGRVAITWLLAAWFSVPEYFQMLLVGPAECAPALARVSMLASLSPRFGDSSVSFGEALPRFCG